MLARLSKFESSAPLAGFRIVLGLLLFASTVRFWAKGWIYDLYIAPKYYFNYYGFEFIKPLGDYTYILFAICAISALLVAFGLFYRIGIVLLFLSFTYIELIDKSTYLNHYYFTSLICLLMIFLPANRSYSLDARRKSAFSSDQIPAWCTDSLKLFICILYVYAGLAKINSDWLLRAEPLRIWLPAKNDTPLIGRLFDYEWVAFAFSWMGCLYDLFVAFLLWNKKSRPYAYLFVIVFHILTAVLFPIGMFPYIMMGTALIFFSAEFHQKWLSKLSFVFGRPANENSYHFPTLFRKLALGCLGLFFIFNLIFPWRYLLYPGELFWTEEGFRFSWRVMLMEKAGYAQFTVKDKEGHFEIVNNSNFLTPLQEKMMATQPDMILQYAHFLRDYYSSRGFVKPSVTADTYVSLNGRAGAPLIDPEIDLTKEHESFKHKAWILPLKDEIKGF